MNDGFTVAESSRLGRRLGRARGYSVYSTDRRRLGRIIWLTYALDELEPAGLRVQPPGPHERAPVGSWEIPFDRVVSVVPERREVTVADPGTRAIERAGRSARPAPGELL